LKRVGASILLTLASLIWCVPAYPKKPVHPLIKIRKQAPRQETVKAQPQNGKQPPKYPAHVQNFRRWAR
jgi:hypothetical protein